ncbi:hypothetical protein [Longimicrobium sp.]|uniref:hypothetical protein n=1 Tax=Longimicrobium sp. TaxID=2029185 RepID=UPI002CFE6A0B|nr:hypothetical protein [Longimicrobium sp.]HSU14732.1 hypothetical protein [Longimicrobium sp.]
MRKIRLNLEALDVEAFETSAAEPARGTVQGQWSQPGTCDAAFVATCQVNGTCVWTCGSRCQTTTPV